MTVLRAEGWKAATRSGRPLRAPLFAGRLPRQRETRLRREESGSALIEFAITISVLMTFLLGITQMCLAWYTYETMSDLAREGTRWAMVRGSTCETAAAASCAVTTTQIQNYVTGLSLPNVGGGTVHAVASFPGNGGTCASGSNLPGCPVMVTVTYTYPYKIPLVRTMNLAISSTSEMTIVQ